MVHTGGEGEHAAWEIVHSHQDLARWLGVVLEVDGIRARLADLPTMRTLRRAIASAAYGEAAGQPLPQDALATINA